MEVYGFAPARPRRGHNQVLRPFMPESIGLGLSAYGLDGTSTSVAWPAANVILYIPIDIVEPFTIVEVAWENGTGASAGNVDLGIYDEGGTKLASLGLTARGAASTLITTTTWTDYTITSPGLYYMAMLHTATNNIFAWAPVAGLCQAQGVMEEASATLPATATFATTTRAYIPDCMFLARSTAL